MSARPTWYEIDLGAIAHNTRELRRLVGANVALYVCLKRNGYGCGAVDVARAAMAAGADGMAAGNPDDAIAVRKAGIAGPLLLYPSCLPDAAPTIEAHDLIVSLSTPEEARAWNGAFTRPRPVFLKVDIGLFRAGALPQRARELFAAVKSLDRLRPIGIYGHFYGYGAEVSPAHYRWQFENMRRAHALAAADGLDLKIAMASSTATVLDHPDMDLTGVDPGFAFYGAPGRSASRRGAQLRPAFVAFKTRLLLRKSLKDADAGGHAPPFAIRPDMEIGVLPVGWGDGLPRPLPEGARALIRGRPARLLGPVHLEQTRIDLTDHQDARPGDEVVLIGRQGESELALGEVLATWRMDPGAFLATLRDHVARRYLPAMD